MTGGKLCRACGMVITGDWAQASDWHVGCIPTFTKVPGMDMTSFDLELKEDLIEVIRWASNNSQRSLQVALGVSEVGSDCDLKIAYRMAGMPEISRTPDPWPSIVGTSIHTWMEQAVNDFQQVHSISRWITEMTVAPNPLVKGHTDLYDQEQFTVLDYKFPSPDNFRQMKKEGPSQQYMTQVQLYGLGHENAGRRVDRVGIVALGRQGWLKDLYVHTVPYDRTVAEKALQRIYDLGAKMIELGLPESGAWQEIPRTPSRLCSWCPQYNRDVKEPGTNGCPGK